MGAEGSPLPGLTSCRNDLTMIYLNLLRLTEQLVKHALTECSGDRVQLTIASLLSTYFIRLVASSSPKGEKQAHHQHRSTQAHEDVSY